MIHEEEIKYLPEGQAVYVLEKMTNGKFVVSKIYETEEERWCDKGKCFIVEKVFDEPPCPQLHESATFLQDRIDKLSEKLDALKKNQNELEQKERKLSSKYEKFEALNLLNDFLDGKITHYVTNDSNLPKIVEAKDTKNLDRSSNYWKENLNLLTLSCHVYDVDSLKWSIRKSTRDEHVWVYPCTSYEMARDIFKELLFKIINNKNNTPNKAVIGVCDKYEVEVPTEYRNRLIEIERSQILHHLQIAQNNVASYQKILNDLPTI